MHHTILKIKLVASKRSRTPSFGFADLRSGSLYSNRFIENIEDTVLSFSLRPQIFETVLFYYFP
jgi:hypothetical protein